ncbi:MAG: glycosyltransferase family 2 protein [Desulfarculaceae bacterium]|nr:glycosyltransferase family 2 protein [Desulfarculaceae bacterium]
MNISVIVTTYNWPRALERVMEGLFHQTVPPFEIIVADDGSTEETRDLVEKLQEKRGDPVKHVWQEDKGFRVARIRNRAILQTSGEYVVFLDGDCIPERHFIEDHLHLAEQGFFFQGKRVLVNRSLAEDFTSQCTMDKGYLIRRMLKGELANFHHVFRVPFVPAFSSASLQGIRSCNMGIYAHDLFAVNGFNESFTGWGREDSEIAARFFRYGLKRKQHPFRAVCYHLWHQENKRDRLEENDALLQQTLDGDGIFCENGLVKKKSL